MESKCFQSTQDWSSARSVIFLTMLIEDTDSHSLAELLHCWTDLRLGHCDIIGEDSVH